MGVLKIKQITPDGRTKSWKLDSSKIIHTFGLSRKANIISIDSTHGSFEGVFEYQNNQWQFIQFNPSLDQPNTAILDKCSLNLKNSKIECQVIQLIPYIQNSLSQVSNFGEGKEKYKILLVLNGGQLLKTEVRPENHQFIYMINGENKKINFKLSDDWQSQDFENYTFKCKTFKAENISELGRYKNDEELGKENKYLLFATLAFFALIVSVGIFSPKNEVIITQPEKSVTNIVVKLDPKKMEQIKKAKGASAPKLDASAPPPAQAQQNENPPPAGNKVSALIKGAVGARIAQLIGKVSATDARTENVLVTAQGRKAGEGPSGKALSAVGQVETSGRNWGGEAVGSGQGVSTAGIAGGKGTSGVANGLGAGKTGSGGVGLIEEESEVDGGLDREVIAQYIKTQLGQILYCYERQLSANPDLYGKVAVRFTIGPTGQVESQNIGDTTLKSSPVEGCILGKVSKWKFPEPKGGTKVMVTYPFLFKSTN